MRKWAVTGVAGLLLLARAAPGQEKKEPAKPPVKVVAPPSLKHLDGKIVIFSVDGSGDSTELTANLTEVLREQRVPACMKRLRWARFGEVLRDHTDHEAQLAGAQRLACWVAEVRRDAPRAYIHLVAHSSGTRVVLAAAEMMPPHSVDRIFLLASSVSATYDLRGALRASKGGIDSFYSHDDGTLQLAEDQVGTADGTRQPSAGRVGFCVPRPIPGVTSPDLALYQNLRQIQWRDDLGHETGQGGHFTWTQPGSLARFVVPQFFVIPSATPVVTRKD